MAGGGGGGEGEPEFQIAPMIDVLLVLLIFFMSITTAQVLKVDKSVKLPVAPNAIKKDTQRSEVIINVRWSPATKKAIYIVDEKEYLDTTELTKAITAAKKIGETRVAKSANPTFRAVIRGDRETTATYISRAMNCAAEAGISDISFSAVNKD
jgi:biopolymer transport protein ExbD